MGFHEHNTTHNPQNGIALQASLSDVQPVPSLEYLCKKCAAFLPFLEFACMPTTVVLQYKCLGRGNMSNPVFRIPRKKYGGDTTVVSMRISRELLKNIDKVADLSGRNRNEILTMSLAFALKHTEILMQDGKK